MAGTPSVTRSGVLADEIAAASPHLVGLQEVTAFELAPGVPIIIDYLDILLAQLQARGQSYVPVSSIQNVSVTLPVPGVGLLNYSDSEVILARSDVAVANSDGGTYGAAVIIPGVIVVPSGRVSINAEIDGQLVRVFSTHLETSSFAPVQEAQAAELIGKALLAPMPVILLGDFNLNPRIAGGTGTQTYPAWSTPASWTCGPRRTSRRKDSPAVTTSCCRTRARASTAASI